MKKNRFFIFSILLTLMSSAWSESFFSGFAGTRLNYSPNVSAEKYDADITAQAFVQGQFTFSQNLWSHIEFSIDTDDFVSTELFHATDAKFKIDEISLIFRSPIEVQSNYLSLFMGTYDPIGSDIFFQRYFGIQQIGSMLTKSWLGLSGSILYPHLGLGISDVVKFYKQPIAAGLYAYLNHEDDKYFVMNGDLRFACVYRFLAFDFAGGVGFPLANKYKGEEVIFAVDTVYWHAGTTLLLGNNYTQSLFLQAGLWNAPFKKTSGKIGIGPDNLYIFVEPRLRIANAHVNISIYSLPQETVKDIMLIDDPMGLAINFYTDRLSWGADRVSLGIIAGLSFPGKNFANLLTPMEFFTNTFKNKEFDVTAIPYIQSNFLGGELKSQIKIRPLKLIGKQWYNAISADFGFKTSL